ncbi:MAG: hypothetical protein OHK0057_24510 [Thermoflexibacter sp.]
MINFPKSLKNVKRYYAVVHSVSEASKNISLKNSQSSIQEHQNKHKDNSKFS